MRWIVTTPAVAMALALTGCGSGPAASVPKSDFIREADAICAKADRDTKAIGPELPLSDVLQRSGAIAAKASADIRALPQPSGSAAQIGRWLHLIDQDVALFPAFERAAKGGDRTLLDALSARSGRIESRARKLAGQIGFHACAS